MPMACTTLSFLVLKSCNGDGDELDFWPQEWADATVVVYENICSQRLVQQQPCEPLENHQNLDTISVTLSKEVSSFMLG